MKKGVVIKSTGSWYTVSVEDGEEIACRIKGKFRLQNIETTNPVAVGDIVLFEELDDETGVIKKIEERKNYIIRKSVNLSKRAHIIASNVDQAFLVVTIKNPKTYTYFIDRFLVSAEAYGITTIIVFNKIDLLADGEKEELENLIGLYTEVGYTCIKTSVEDGIGLEKLKKQFKNKTSMIGGHSGVGKSSLLNAIDGNLSIKIGEISTSHKQGKHTTTYAEMHPLSFGGYVIDTPGIRGLGLIDIEKDKICHYYPEFVERMQLCKFHNCIHINEPKCAIKSAVENGDISLVRYDNYLNLYYEDDESNYRESLYEPK